MSLQEFREGRLIDASRVADKSYIEGIVFWFESDEKAKEKPKPVAKRPKPRIITKSRNTKGTNLGKKKSS